MARSPRSARWKSNVRSSKRPSEVVVALGVMLVAALAIGLIRPRSVERFTKLKATSDVYALPAPEQSIVASLGYRAALADVIFAHVLVSYGLHFGEKRRFEFVGNYLDTINALDPTFRAPYLYADTLLTLGPTRAREEDYVKAREILERGMRNLPNDQELHSVAGQYMAYLAPGGFSDPATKQEWQLAGARALSRACELIGSNENIPYHCVTAAQLFTRAGKREAAIRFVERVLSVSDNEEIRAIALGHLEEQMGELEKDRVDRRFAKFRERWGKDLPFVSKDFLLVIGPRFDAARCAGPEHASDPECVTSWREWGERVEQEFSSR